MAGKSDEAHLMTQVNHTRAESQAQLAHTRPIENRSSAGHVPGLPAVLSLQHTTMSRREAPSAVPSVMEPQEEHLSGSGMERTAPYSSYA